MFENQPFRSPHHNKKRGSYRKCPYRGQSTPSSYQSFSSGRGKPSNRSSGGRFRPHPRGCGCGISSPNDSLKASLSPPVGGFLHSFRRDCQTEKCSNNMLNIITNGYVLPFITKPKLARIPDSLGIQGPAKRSSSNNRPKQAQHAPTSRKIQNRNTKIHQGLSDSKGMGVVDRPVRRFSSHPHPPKLKEVPTVLPQFSDVPVHLPPFRPNHSPTSIYNDCKGSEADGLIRGGQTSRLPGQLAYQGPIPGGGKSEHSDRCRPNTVLRVDNQSCPNSKPLRCLWPTNTS